MKQTSFYQLFTEQLQDIYNAENQILQALPKMVEAASLPELKEAFQTHFKDTQRQLQRLKKIFTHLGVTHLGKTCKGMEGLIHEGQEIINHLPSCALRDAALISAAQKIEHYEISGYGTARTYAKHLELDQVADLLQENLDEEGLANKKLTRLAEGSFFNRGINEEAKKEETGLNTKKLREINRGLIAEDIKSKKAKISAHSKNKIAEKKASTKAVNKRKSTGLKAKVKTGIKSLSSKVVKNKAPAKKTGRSKVAPKLNVSSTKSTRSTARTGVSKRPSHSASLSGRSSPARSVSSKGKSSRTGIQARGRR